MTPEPRAEPDSYFEPDAAPDEEAVAHVWYEVGCAMVNAFGDGRVALDYDDHPERRHQLLALCADITRPYSATRAACAEFSVLDLVEHGHYTDAAAQIERFELRNCRGGWHDESISDLKAWLRRRNRP